MKKIFSIVALVAATCCYAQENAPQMKDDYCFGKLPGYPEHYCTCRNSSQTFQFPLEVQVADTMWYQASVNDLKQGLSAYWFSNCSLTFEVYAFCSSKTPTITMTVGANQMREMDVAEINRKLDEMGNVAELLSQALTPRIKVYPNGGTGTVYCYPYDQGPVSTCSDLLPVIPRMTYVCDQETEVYELQPIKIASSGKAFIRWRQKRNLPGNIRLTTDSCNGLEIANVILTDSTRVFIPDALQLKAAKNAGKSIFVHVTHPADYVGRINYHNQIVWDEQAMDTTICQGKSLQLIDTVLSETTVYPNDTLWKKGDTLSLTTYHLTIEPPTPVYDTLLLKAKQLPYNYRNQIIPKDGWGEYDFTIHQTDRCDERYLVHVEHDIVTRETTLDTTTCLGKTVTFGDVTYATDTVIRDSAWIDADTWAIRDITISFTEPEMEYDTIAIPASWFSNGRYWYGDLGVTLFGYGDTLIVKTKKNTCTRWIQLHIEEREISTDLDAVPQEEQIYKYMRDGVMYIRREGQEYDLLGRPVTNKQH